MLVACSSDSKTATGSSGGAAGSAKPTLSGDPVKVAFLSIFGTPGIADNPEYLAAMKATADYVNDNGGIKGRPMQVYECQAKGDENEARKCASDAAADSQVLAVVQNSTFGAVQDPLLEAAKLASIGSFPLDASDYKSPIYFPFTNGGVGAAGAESSMLVESANIAKVQVVTFGGAQGPQIATLMGAIQQNRLGSTIAGTTLVDPTTTDLSPQVNEAAGADGAAIILTKDLASKFAQTAQQLGFDKPMGTTLQGLPTDALKDLGDAAKNMYVVSTQKSYVSDNNVPGLKAFAAVMDSNGKDVVRNDNAVNGYLSIKAIADSANKLATLDRASFLDAWNKTTAFDTGGITPTIDFTKPSTVLAGAFPRMFNQTVVYYKWNSSTAKLDQVSPDFVDPFAKK
jgi:ABC-type branched-subunit amino acid transport system substrate-binding protein